MLAHDPASLENLHGIVEPAPVSLWWPLAPGWWAVLALLALATAIGIWRFVRARRLNAYRRQGLAELDITPPQELPALLKRVALSAYPRDEVAGLTGDRWIEFLNRTAPDSFDTVSSERLRSLAYQANQEAHDDHLFAACRSWIEQHRPGKEAAA